MTHTQAELQEAANAAARQAALSEAADSQRIPQNVDRPVTAVGPSLLRQAWVELTDENSKTHLYAVTCRSGETAEAAFFRQVHEGMAATKDATNAWLACYQPGGGTSAVKFNAVVSATEHPGPGTRHPGATL